MKQKVLIGVIFLFSIYFLGYIGHRQSHSEVWERDGKTYVIFPENKFLYYFWRPLSYVDHKMTRLDFHIGPHG